jgi:hypothetical protein
MNKSLITISDLDLVTNYLLVGKFYFMFFFNYLQDFETI